MANPEELYDDFIDDKLSLHERKAFIEKVNSNPTFKSSFESHRNDRIDIESFFLKKAMNKWHHQSNPIENKNRRNYWLIISIILAMIAMGLFVMNHFNKPNKDVEVELQWASLYIPDPGLPTRMNVQLENKFLTGMVWYKAADYNRALENWKGLPSTDTLMFFKAQIDFGNKQYDLAENKLKKIDYSSSYYAKSQWYQLLICLTNENNNCNNYFNELNRLSFRLKEVELIKEKRSNLFLE